MCYLTLRVVSPPRPLLAVAALRRVPVYNSCALAATISAHTPYPVSHTPSSPSLAPSPPTRLAGMHLNVRIAGARRLLSTARVVVTDRLHCSLLALLQFQFHVALDNSYGKIWRTRGNAFNSSAACGDPRALRYASATGNC
jgi:hypothetical protein